MTRTIEHGNRNGYASLGAGGLSTESFPMRLFAKGNAKHWNPAEIDFSNPLGAPTSSRSTAPRPPRR